MSIYDNIITNENYETDVLYDIESIFTKYKKYENELINALLDLIKKNIIYPNKAKIKIILYDKIYEDRNINEETWIISYEVIVEEEKIGSISIYSDDAKFDAVDIDKVRNTTRFINSIAFHLGKHLEYLQLQDELSSFKEQSFNSISIEKSEWFVILEMLKKTDHTLFSIVSRKMLNKMFCKGIKDSHALYKKLGSNLDFNTSVQTETNKPTKKQLITHSYNLGMEIFALSAKYFSTDEILKNIQKWIHEERASFLIKALQNQNTPLSEISDSLRRYHYMNPSLGDKKSSIRKGIRVSLIRRFFTDQLQYINVAKNYLEVDDFYKILRKTIFPSDSHGKLGGKSAGLMLAKKIVDKLNEYSHLLHNVRIPRTWYITSDGLKNFMYFNNFEDIMEQKYRDIDEIRQEYPHIIQALKNGSFPSEMVNGLSRALDDFGDKPIIVRSSSLLEDRIGTAFAGKYKSLFLANQGTKQQRLEELLDAIAEVYASTFGPDPIGYRIEKGLLDFNEEMAIMIQEVVGTRVGKYYFPSFAGVAFSFNEFRWSTRIKREDGLIRIVTGLGSRAVDRVGNDFPVLIAPGKPELRVNQSYQEIINYAPKYMDVINLEKNMFESIPIRDVVKEVGNKFPNINDIFSIDESNYIKQPLGLGINTNKDDIVVTFENLRTKTKYIHQLNTILKELKDTLNTPVDIEFACDGDYLYLLQCRPQTAASENVSAVLPVDWAPEKTIFTANKYVSNGKVPNISYIVYVDPEEYYRMENYDDLREVGVAVGKLNKLLPKKTFILMGPGRWGTRDDVRLGVKVGYADINNSSMIIELAKKKGSYTPDLSFGTHFFLDLVESSIRYLPLYPDEEGVFFNDNFLRGSNNTLTRFLPEYDYLEKALRVINVREVTDGLVLRVLMNAEEDRAMAILVHPDFIIKYGENSVAREEEVSDEPLQWRRRMAESIALQLDSERFGVKGLYLYGTVYNGTATSNSDIDIIVHYDGNPKNKENLIKWFEGWNLCLGTINYNKTGFSLERILDISYISDEELPDQQYYADLLNLSNNTAMKLTMQNEVSKDDDSENILITAGDIRVRE